VEQSLDLEFLNRLQEVRNQFGEGIAITSGCRCERHQLDLTLKGFKTSKNRSTHVFCNTIPTRAVDIVPVNNSKKNIDRLYSICDNVFKSVGDARSKNNAFIHVDARIDAIRRWNY
jgi:hypothetical protein